MALTAIAYTEILLEKLASRDGCSDDLVVALEAIKALLRLMVLASTSQPLLIDGGKYWSTNVAMARADHAAMASGAAATTSTTTTSPPAADAYTTSIRHPERHIGTPFKRPQIATGRRTGRRFHYEAIGEAEKPIAKPANPASPERAGADEQGGDADVLLTSLPVEVMTTTTITTTTTAETQQEEGEEEERRRKLLLFLGEVLHILRPVIYTYCLRKSRRKRSWWPFLLSALIAALNHTCTQRGIGRDLSRLDHLQQQELQRRRMLWFLYLLRSPIFQLLTEPVASSAHQGLSHVPLVGGLSSYGLQMLRYIHTHYFYISGS